MSTESNNQLQKVQSTDDIVRMGKVFFESGMFNDIQNMAAAIVKVQAGAELGIPPFQAISGVHVIKGKAVMGAGLMASMLDRHPEYDYEVLQQTDKVCEIKFYKNGKVRGTSKFTEEDAKRAGTQNMGKFPANMLYARAMSNGVKFYAPGLFAGPVYVPEEFEEQKTVDTTYTEVKEEYRPDGKLAVNGKTYEEAAPEERAQVIEAQEVKEEQGISDEQAEQILELLKHPAQAEATVKKVTNSLYSLSFEKAAQTIEVLQKKINTYEKAQAHA